MIPCHEIRYNEQYKAVHPMEFSLGCFSHFRYPQNEKSKKRIGTYQFMQESAEAVFSLDLLDKIANPTFWSAQTNTTLTWGTARSLLWPGYLSYMSFKRPCFGGIYFGCGMKQTELPFFV